MTGRFMVALGFLLGIAPAVYADSIGQKIIEAQRTNAGMSVEVSIGLPDGGDQRAATLTAEMQSADACFAIFRGAAGWSGFCELMDKGSLRNLTMAGTMAEQEEGLFAGILTTQSGFSLGLRLMLDINGSVIAIAAQRSTEPPGAVVFEGNVADAAPEPALRAATTYTLRRGGVDSTFVIRPNADGTALSATMRLSLQGSDNSLDLNGGWGRLSETAFKDGPRLLTGILQKDAQRSDIYVGVMTAVDTGLGFWVSFRDLPEGPAIGVQMPGRDVPLPQTKATWEIVYGTEALQPRREVDLTTEPWRVATEEIANLGAHFNVSFARKQTGYSGTITGFFPASPDVYCPSTTAYLRICERLTKDGPLDMTFILDERRSPAAFGWSGQVRPVADSGFNVGPWAMDVYEGSSIGDWGGEDPDAVYLRIRATDAPGAEPVAWLKLVKGTSPLSDTTQSNRIAPYPADVPRQTRTTETDRDLVAQQVCTSQFQIAYATAKQMDASQFVATAVFQNRTTVITNAMYQAALVQLYTESIADIADLQAANAPNLLEYCTVVTRTINGWKMGEITRFPLPTDAALGTAPVDANTSKPEACSRVYAGYSALPTISDQNAARILLQRDPRLGTWQFPDDVAGCSMVLQIFSENGVSGF